LKKKKFTTILLFFTLFFLNINTQFTNSYEIIADNSKVIFQGSWSYSTKEPNYWDSNYRVNYAGTGQDTATWSFEIPQAGDWEVLVWYTSHTNRARA
jgi:hypothetical protein